jgi:hypothetical protein
MKSVARRITDRQVLHLIKMWIEAPAMPGIEVLVSDAGNVAATKVRARSAPRNWKRTASLSVTGNAWEAER